MPNKKKIDLGTLLSSGSVIGKLRRGGKHYVVKYIDRGVGLREVHYFRTNWSCDWSGMTHTILIVSTNYLRLVPLESICVIALKSAN